MRKIILSITFILLFTISTSFAATPIFVGSHQKISDTEGSFTATLIDNDLFGMSVENIGDLDGDGVEDLAVGAPGDDDGGTNRGAIYILFMNADGTVKNYQKISDTAGGLTATFVDGDYFGVSIANLGDVNNDGIQDLAVGASRDNTGGTSSGAVYILFMDSDGTVDDTTGYQKISEGVGDLVTTLDVYDAFGISVAGIGDLDGDGIEDLVVGARGDDDGCIIANCGCGAVYVLFLGTDGKVDGEQKISELDGDFIALDDYDNFGTDVAYIGDLNNDGIEDIAVGTSGDDDGAASAGAIYVLFLGTDGRVDGIQKISDIQGELTASLGSSWFGSSVSGISDVDGDVIGDILVGAPRNSDGGQWRGAGYVLFMDTDGTVDSTDTDYIKINDTAGSFTATLDNSDFFGQSISDIGDLDGNGVPDLVVGAYSDDDGGSARGAVYVLFMASGYTVSGRLYSDEGITAVTSNANATVSVAVNGVLAGTDSDGTDASGDWQIIGVNYSAGDIITVYLNGVTIPDNAVTVAVGPGTVGDILGLDLYYDNLIVRHENAGSITNANLDTAHNGDTDITAIYADGGVNDLDLAESLYIKAGDAYTPGGNIDIAGDWNNQGSFIAGTFSAVFDGTAQSISGTTTFNDFTKIATVAESLTFENGTTTEIAGTFTLDGNTGQAITINSDSAGIAATTNVTGSLGTLDYLDIKDNNLQEGGVTKDPALNAVNAAFASSSTNSGNSAGWYTASLTYSASAFQEAAADDGSIGDSITIDIVGDIFDVAVLDGTPFAETTHYTVANLPAGLTPLLTKTSSTSASFTLTGNATSHETGDYINNFTINFTDTAFAFSTAAEVTNSSKSDIEVSFFTAPPVSDPGGGAAPFLSVLIGNTPSDNEDSEEEPEEEPETEPVEEEPEPESEPVVEEPAPESEPELPVSPVLDAAEELFFPEEPVYYEQPVVEVVEEPAEEESSDTDQPFSDEELQAAVDEYLEGEGKAAGNEPSEKLSQLMAEEITFQEEVNDFQDTYSDLASEIFDSGETIKVTKSDGTQLEFGNLEDYEEALFQELKSTHPSLIDWNNNRVSDFQEYLYGVNPFKDDEDGDGIPSWKEIMCNSTDPLESDELDLAVSYEDGITIGNESAFLLCSSQDSQVNIGLLSKEEYENGNYKELLELGSGEFEDSMTFIDPDKEVEDGKYYLIMQGEGGLKVMHIIVSDTEALNAPTITQTTGEIGSTVQIVFVLYGSAEPSFDVEARIAAAEKIYISADVGVLQFVFSSRVVYSTVFSDASQIEVRIPSNLAFGEGHIFTAYIFNQSAVSDVATVVFAR